MFVFIDDLKKKVLSIVIVTLC